MRDKKGRLVKNLKPGDVEIFEDGVRQEIRSLRLVSGEASAPQDQPGGRIRTRSGGPRAAAGDPATDVNLLCIVFQQLDSSTRKWAVAAVQDFIKTQLRPGHLGGNLQPGLAADAAASVHHNRNELLRAAAHAFNGYSVDITRAADAVLNSTPNVSVDHVGL